MSVPPHSRGPSAYLGQITLVAFKFAPIGCELCNGQLLDISKNTALFNLLGTTYGGDGVRTFGLPDLRGRVPIHVNEQHQLGEAGGVEAVTLTPQAMPTHSHRVAAHEFPGEAGQPSEAYPAIMLDLNAGTLMKSYQSDHDTLLAADAAEASGNSEPHPNLQPYMAINFIIATQGAVPPHAPAP